MKLPRLCVTGTSGLFLDEAFEIECGLRVTVGRSRYCELSAVKTRYSQRIGRAILERSRSFRLMSRRHFVITVSEEGVDIEDTSRNGVRIFGQKLSQARFSWEELNEKRPRIAFGGGELLELAAVSDYD